jgi:RimJ/RimL family protein N-acetyltransferase
VLIRTERLTLRSWCESDRAGFAALNASREVTADLGGPLGREESGVKFDRYVAAFEQHGLCRWTLNDGEGQLIGYAGIMPSRTEHPLGPHFDIGWRLMRAAWGKGYATEAARAALRDGFERTGLEEVLAYTSADNARSLAVIARLHLQRAAALDYSEPLGAGEWRGLVWKARAEQFA